MPRRVPNQAAVIARSTQAPAWDLPTRLFHWALTALVVFSYVTGKLGGEAMVDRMSAIHGWVQVVLVIAVALHVAAVLFYQLGLRIDVLRTMTAGAPTAPRTVALAAAFAAASAAVVYWLVMLYPKP